MPNGFRFKYDNEEIHNSILHKAIKAELKIKKTMFKKIILNQRRAYLDALKIHRESLIQYIKNNMEAINLERASLMLQTPAAELKRL